MRRDRFGWLKVQILKHQSEIEHSSEHTKQQAGSAIKLFMANGLRTRAYTSVFTFYLSETERARALDAERQTDHHTGLIDYKQRSDFFHFRACSSRALYSDKPKNRLNF